MSSSVNVYNKKQDILTFGERTTQGLGTTRYRRTYLLILHNQEKDLYYALHYNGSNSFLFANTGKVYQFKAKNSEVKEYALYLRNILQLII